MKKSIYKLATVAALAVSSVATLQAQDIALSPSADEAVVHIITPENRQTIKTGPVEVQFGLNGMGVAPAGIDVANTGHHHLLVNYDSGQLDVTQPLPSSDQVRHFGKGQTETTLDLEPGLYTLQLILANHLHVPHDPAVLSEVVHITVE